MSNITYCKAKDPATCRFHRPDAGEIAFSAWKEAEKTVSTELNKYNKALSLSDEDGSDVDASAYLDAQWQANIAQETYYGTSDGVIALMIQLEETTDETARYNIQNKLDIARYRVQEQERQNDIDNAAGGPLIPLKVDSTYVPPTITGGGDYLWPESKGSKYDSAKTLVQIKSGVNADIKEAQKKGYLPKNVKFEVRASSGRLSVKIVGAADTQIYNDPEEKRNNDLTDNARELKNRVSTLVMAYNKTQGDTIEGRRNSTKFWEHIDFESDWDKQRKQLKANFEANS